MKTKPQRVEYQIHMIYDDADHIKSNELFEKKFSELSLYSSSKAETNTIAEQSTMIVLRNEELSFDEKPTYPTWCLPECALENCSTLMNVASFINTFCYDDNADFISIRMNSGDVDGFRLASFIAGYCVEMKKRVSLQFFSNKEVLPLYKPHISNSTLHLLFSLVDYWLATGNFPLFGELKEHHFKNLEQIESNKKHWDSSRDSQFVSTIYASLRAMQRLVLIQKEFHETKRKMVSIRSTINGLLTVLFSRYFAQFKSQPGIETDEEVWDDL